MVGSFKVGVYVFVVGKFLFVKDIVGIVLNFRVGGMLVFVVKIMIFFKVVWVFLFESKIYR